MFLWRYDDAPVMKVHMKYGEADGMDSNRNHFCVCPSSKVDGYIWLFRDQTTRLRIIAEDFLVCALFLHGRGTQNSISVDSRIQKKKKTSDGRIEITGKIDCSIPFQR